MTPTKVLLALNKDQQLTVRNLQVASQAAQLKTHQYKQQADVELQRLQVDANNKAQAVLNYLNQVGTAAKLDTTKVLFDFESLAFIDNTPMAPPAPPAPLAGTPATVPPVEVLPPAPAAEAATTPAVVAPPETAS
jgi:hypothetical protein